MFVVETKTFCLVLETSKTSQTILMFVVETNRTRQTSFFDGRVLSRTQPKKMKFNAEMCSLYDEHCVAKGKKPILLTYCRLVNI